MKECLRNFVRDELVSTEAPVEIRDDENLLLSGLVDSVGMMRLVMFIEEHYTVAVPPEDVTIDNFCTISAIAAYLAKKVS